MVVADVNRTKVPGRGKLSIGGMAGPGEGHLPIFVQEKVDDVNGVEEVYNQDGIRYRAVGLVLVDCVREVTVAQCSVEIPQCLMVEEGLRRMREGNHLLGPRRLH